MRAVRRSVWVGGLVLAAAVAGAGFWYGVAAPHRAAAASGQPAAPPAVPVQVVAAKSVDFPVYLRGLGTVEAVDSIEVRAQVSGVLLALPVTEGQEVTKGEVVAQIDPRPYQAALDQAAAQRAEDQAQLASARLDLGRYRTLAQRSFAPVQQVDDQQATVNKLAAAVEADSAAVEQARLNLGFTSIRSPVTGRISLFQTDAGNLIEAANQTNILSITQDKPIDVVFTLPEGDFLQVQQALAASGGHAPVPMPVPVRIYSNDGRKQLAAGTLLAPNNSIDTTTGTIQLKAVFPNQDDHLWPGAFVDAWLLANTLHGAVTVPVPAVQHGPEGTFVYVVRPDGTAQQQTVTLGDQDEGTAVVASGLAAGDSVVLTGQSRLSSGVRVSVQASPPASGAPPASGQAQAKG